MTSVDDLAAWLTQIWDEREAQFVKACEAEAEYLRSDGMPDTTADEVREFWLRPESDTGWALDLARIAADRQILARLTALETEQKRLNREYQDWVDGNDSTHPKPARFSETERKEILGLRMALRFLASAYADRPGYREEWLVSE